MLRPFVIRVGGQRGMRVLFVVLVGERCVSCAFIERDQGSSPQSHRLGTARTSSKVRSNPLRKSFDEIPGMPAVS